MSKRGPKKGTVNNPQGKNQYSGGSIRSRIKKKLPAYRSTTSINSKGQRVTVEKTLLGDRVKVKDVKKAIAAQKEASAAQRRLYDKIQRENSQLDRNERAFKANKKVQAKISARLDLTEKSSVLRRAGVLSGSIESDRRALNALRKKQTKIIDDTLKNSAQRKAYMKAYRAKKRKDEAAFRRMFFD